MGLAKTSDFKMFVFVNKGRIAALMMLLALSLPMVGCLSPTIPMQSSANNLAVPSQADWTDYGPILESGALGEWDYILWGGFAGTTIKKDGLYYLYYQGVSGYQLVPDETVTWRTIGVATSPDGINFTKYNNNPVLTWFPNNDGEEGAVSGGVTLDDDGDIVMYYGANTEISPTLVNADGRIATSADGLNFTDQGIALDHNDGTLWGSGDELFPVIAIHDIGQWFVYYIPNGTLQTGNLGVAWGNSSQNLTNSTSALYGITSIPAWGMGGAAKIGPDTYALFINDVRDSKFEVRTVSLNTPGQLSAPIETYQFDDIQQGTVLLDEETNTWFMYYRNKEASWYGVKLASVGIPDTTPPSAPANIITTPINDRQIDLTWNPATDSETGIVQYNVFRDGIKVATVKGWSFSDNGLDEQREYNYTVSAVNYHAVEGPQSVPVTATTLADVTPPQFVSVNASGNPNQIIVVFDEPVEQTSTETPSNYTINKGISITSASLSPDFRTVILTTSEHDNDSTYLLTINGVLDRAEPPNSIAPDTKVNYTYSTIAGLVGAWTFDEGTGETSFDTANYGNDGELIYTNKPGPIWSSGKFESALQFDGIDDQVTIDGSGSLENVTDGNHTFIAWVKPDSVPPNTAANDAFYSILVRQYTGLYYDHNQKFKAEIKLNDNTVVAVSSDQFDPGIWHHLVMMVDDSNKKLHLYVDGQEVGGSPTSYNGSLADHGDAPYYIGTSEPLTNLYEYRFEGHIDEVRVYNRALTSLEILALFEDFSVYQEYLPVILKLQ